MSQIIFQENNIYSTAPEKNPNIIVLVMVTNATRQEKQLEERNGEEGWWSLYADIVVAWLENIGELSGKLFQTRESHKITKVQKLLNTKSAHFICTYIK